MHLKWTELTSHQKKSEVYLASDLTLQELEDLTFHIIDPFDGLGRITWRIENDVHVLKFHAQKYDRGQNG
jgi:hypothetical protein